MSIKITSEHLGRIAVVYVRQTWPARRGFLLPYQCGKRFRICSTKFRS